MNKALTISPADLRNAILHIIGEYQMQHGYSPSRREIAQALSLSTTPIQENILILVDEGYLTHVPGLSRTLRLTEKGVVGYVSHE